jgi:hypothetical protein
MARSNLLVSLHIYNLFKLFSASLKNERKARYVTVVGKPCTLTFWIPQEGLRNQEIQSERKPRASQNPGPFHIYLFIQCIEHVELIGWNHRTMLFLSVNLAPWA